MLTNRRLLEVIAEERKYTFISTGMCQMKDVENAVKIFKKRKCKFILMHSVSVYPCEEKDLNLKFKGEEQKNKDLELKKKEKELQIRSEEQNRKDVDLKVREDEQRQKELKETRRKEENKN